MNTVTLHADVQRSRFVQLALGALNSLVPPIMRLPLVSKPAPTLSGPELVAAEAHQVRELAHTYAKTDPGFASDLYAAAARHESLYID